MPSPLARLSAALVVASILPIHARAARPTHAAPHAVHRPQAAGAPKRIGKWEEWEAATHQEAGQLVCYAFTRPTNSTPALAGRGDVVLTVTERVGGRDAVAVAAGFAYPPNTEVEVTSEGVNLPFYTSGRSAFARDGRAAVGLFNRGRQAQLRSPGPRGQAVVDTFGLRGFAQAYAAITKACPAK